MAGFIMVGGVKSSDGDRLLQLGSNSKSDDGYQVWEWAWGWQRKSGIAFLMYCIHVI